MAEDAARGSSIELLDTDNYGTWSFRMKNYLISKGLGGCIDGTATTPGSEKDQKALSHIALHVKDHHIATISGCTTSKAAWDALKAVHQAKNMARRQQLRRDINSIKMGNGEPLNKYFNRGKTLWQDLAATGDTLSESELVWTLLHGLPKEYELMVTVFEATDASNLTMDTTLSKLLPIEVKNNRTGEDEGKAFFSNARGRGSRGRGGYSGRGGRSSTGRGSSNSNKHADKECYYCGYKGHISSECRKKQRDESNGISKDKAQGSRSVALASLSNTVYTTPDVWALDSGATRHMTPYQSILSNVKTLEHKIVITFGNGHTAEAVSTGDVEFTSELGKSLILQDVLYIPDMHFNLFSVKCAAEKGATSNFAKGKCFVQQDSCILVEGKVWDGLYTFRAMYNTAKAAAANSKETAELWHRRFGHLGFKNLFKLPNLVKGINVKEEDFKAAAQAVCEPCAMNKQHKQPFPSSTSSKGGAPLSLLHMDVCGPMQVPSLGGSRYTATFLDDTTDLSVVVTSATKAAVPGIIKNVVTLLENQSGRNVKVVRTDRGSEYLNSELKTYYQSKGVVHETTAPYTPQQNGKAERLNRTLMERVRAMLYQSKLPEELWAEAIVTANYIRNRSPVKNKDKTPWELFFGKTPDVSMMRTFGARAYVLIPKQHRSKLDDVSKKGIFVGYEPGSKAYRVLLDTNKKIVISRDVTFDESFTSSSTGGESYGNSSASSVSSDNSDEEDNSDVEDGSAGRAPSNAAGQPAAQAAPAPQAEIQGDINRQDMQQDINEPEGASAARRSKRPNLGKPNTEWYKANVASVEDSDEPQSYEEALKSKNADKWHQAMDEEMASLHE
jgi:hypothetical protein